MAVKRGGLGRGLDSLIPENKSVKSSAKAAPVKKEVVKLEPTEQKIKTSMIEPNRNQPRKNFNEDALLELADSIKQVGVLQPLIVQKKGDRYEIIAGERRWRAAKLAGLKEVPVIVREYTEQEIDEIAMIENLQREDLNPIEEALGYKSLISKYNMKQDEIAEKVSKSRTAITNSMRLLKLNEKVQEMVVDEKISTGHARALLAIENPEEQYALAIRIFDERLSVRETEKLIKQLKEPKAEKPQKIVEKSIFYRDIENKMQSLMGTKVVVNQKANGKGKIEIEYYSTDELERIFDLFMTVSDN